MKKSLPIKLLLCLLFAGISVFCFMACNFGSNGRDTIQDNSQNDSSQDNNEQTENYSQSLEYAPNFDNTGYKVVGVGLCLDSVIKIPPIYQGEPVLEIEANAFAWISSLIGVVIPDSVTSIGNSAFACCGSLTSVEMCDSITSIGNFAFYDCYSLERVNFKGTIDQWAQISFDGYFANPINETNNLYINTELVIEAVLTTATKISEYAFYECYSLTNVVIPVSVTSIGFGAFFKCTSLTSIEIPDGVTSVGGYAFFRCKSLKSVIIGKNVTSIGSQVFDYCESLTSVMFKDTEGWYYTRNYNDYINKTGGVVWDVTNPNSNAEFMLTYNYYYKCK